MQRSQNPIVIGAGPAGLTAAYQLCKKGAKPTVFEMDGQVGGISKTVDYKGYKFDMGGHRFFTKISAVNDVWYEIMGDEFLKRPRLSRIYYQRKFYNYPLKLSNVIWNLGLLESSIIFLSYVKAHLFPLKNESSFEGYIVNRFGRRLYETFFKSYTEKVWGIPCKEIQSEWASQRIKGMSFTAVLKATLLGNRGNKIKSLIEEFHYPREGPGQLWNRMRERLEENGCKVVLNAEVVGVNFSAGKVASVVVKGENGTKTVEGDVVINTMPLRDLVWRLNPKPPQTVLDAAAGLGYRDFITVALIINKKNMWPDNWVYIHDKRYSVGRIQNFGNWSPYMVPDPGKTCIGMEYFAFEGDSLWNMRDEDLIRLASEELVGLSLLADKNLIEDGKVVRVRKAYPTYDANYRKNLETVKEYLNGLKNLYTVGRNGMHMYNNQDHSMLTAMYAVENIEGACHDIWSVNADQEYHETEAQTNDKKKGT